MGLDVARAGDVRAVLQTPEFAVFRRLGGQISVPPELPPELPQQLPPALLAFHLRQALEAAWLRRRGVAPALATLAAARAAAQFIQSEADLLAPADHAALPGWVGTMAAEVVPDGASLARHFAAAPAEIALIRRVWGWLGTAEALMETGGDIRLARDPRSALNGYGCSHRPRPWAITFASSTASSASARGYVAADRARLAATAALLRGTTARHAVRRVLGTTRQGIAAYFGLPAQSKVVLAASGTDTELLALALAHLGGGARQRILNVLIAPEETGRGVPMAARGLHFAVDTARGHDVTFEAPISGFRPDTELANIPLRDKTGLVRPAAAVEAEIEALMAAAVADGRHVVLHALDLSKTGLLAPAPEFLAKLRAGFGAGFDIVVDACQTRLSPGAVRAYLALDAVVLITGSKFFTGPPFAGAALLPPGVVARLRGRQKLPEGLDAYFGQDDFFGGCAAATELPACGNYGLALRWHAALAEMRALRRIAPQLRAQILAGFGATVRAAIAKNQALSLLEAQELRRFADDEPWERLPSIFTFLLRAPHAPERLLSPAEARAVYMWLNTDLSPWLPDEAALAARICHIGQPVPLAQPQGEGLCGALRVAAGARLISGEPTHRGLSQPARLAQEFDDLTTVFHKIALILRHWPRLWAAQPAPCYRRSAAGAWAAASLSAIAR